MSKEPQHAQDLESFDEALALLLNRDLRPAGQHVPEGNPFVAAATKYLLIYRDVIQHCLSDEGEG